MAYHFLAVWKVWDTSPCNTWYHTFFSSCSFLFPPDLTTFLVLDPFWKLSCLSWPSLQHFFWKARFPPSSQSSGECIGPRFGKGLLAGLRSFKWDPIGVMLIWSDGVWQHLRFKKRSLFTYTDDACRHWGRESPSIYFFPCFLLEKVARNPRSLLHMCSRLWHAPI